MFTVYIDDSGTDPSQPSAIASALIIPAARLDELEQRWNKFKTDNFISEFHSAECAAGQRGTDFYKWSSQRKHHVFSQACEITKEFGLNAFSFAVTKSDYDEFVQGELREFGGKYHYTWAVWSLIRKLDEWAINHRLDAPFEYIFDWMGENKRNKARQEIEIVMAQQESLREGFYDGKYSFRKRKDHPALQCTDLLAWTCYQFARSAYLKSPTHPIAWQTFWNFDGHQDQRWLGAFFQSREQIKEWAEREAADVERVNRRKAWIENRQKR
jgi:Protein of unknown function (DUF3800)